MIYQVSYVIRGEKGAGKIERIDHYPQLGEYVDLKGKVYRVVEVEDLIPGRSKFCYVHVLCEPV